jgi:uncharacterized cupredoxin-like copper-binding protein
MWMTSWFTSFAAISAVVLITCGSAATGAPARAAKATSRATPTRVTVTAGKPSEFRFKLSKTTVRHGTVVFKVVNRGTIPHDFKIRGKKTKLLTPGHSATLRVVFTKARRYAYLCTVPGHAAAGMKGMLRVK